MHSEGLLYLSREDVEATSVSMREIIDTLFQLFREKGRGRIEMPPKPGVHPREDASIRAMLAYIPFMDAAGVKWISGYGRNFEKGLPNINGLLILNDSETGVPLAIMDCTWITAQRTGAATAVAAKYFAREDSNTLGIVACGGQQGRTNLRALKELYNIEHVRAFDINMERAEQFASEMESELGVAIEAVQSLERAVQDMDIVVTAGPIMAKPKPKIQSTWLKPGSFTCPLDFDSYVTREAFSSCEKLATDDFGQLKYFRSTGYFRDTPEPTLDLGLVAAGKCTGRENAQERTISINLGIAMHDIAVASLVYKKAQEQKRGQLLQF